MRLVEPRKWRALWGIRSFRWKRSRFVVLLFIFFDFFFVVATLGICWFLWFLVGVGNYLFCCCDCLCFRVFRCFCVVRGWTLFIQVPYFRLLWAHNQKISTPPMELSKTPILNKTNKKTQTYALMQHDENQSSLRNSTNDPLRMARRAVWCSEWPSRSAEVWRLAACCGQAAEAARLAKDV